MQNKFCQQKNEMLQKIFKEVLIKEALIKEALINSKMSISEEIFFRSEAKRSPTDEIASEPPIKPKL